MDELYVPSWFRFSLAEYAAETAEFESVDEYGAYTLLRRQCYQRGSIPTNLARLAKIAKMSEKRMAAIWPTFQPLFAPHPTQPDALIHPGIERERADALAYRDRQAAAGRRSGAARRPNSEPPPNDGSTGAERRFNGGSTMGKPPLNDGRTAAEPSLNQLRNGTIRNVAAAAEELNTSSAPTREESTRFGGEAGDFARWFLGRGIALEVIPEHRKLDPNAWCYRQLDAAEKLIGTYGRSECEARAQRFFAAKKARKIRVDASVIGLDTVWGYAELQPSAADALVPGAASVSGKTSQDLHRETAEALRKMQQGGA